MALCACSASAAAADAVLYRIFLRDGSSLISYGDFARVGDRVVVSVPIGSAEQPQLQLITISEAAVDWQLTDRYAHAARSKQYADTRGEVDFNRLSGEVAIALNEVALTNDPARRVALADGARQQLAEWPASHYGYRAHDVAQLSALLEDVVSELRVAAGQSRFDLKLVAPSVVPLPTMDLLPPPTLRESIELAFTAARVAAEPAERIALLESISRTLTPQPVDGESTAGSADARPEPIGSSGWGADFRARAAAELGAERRVDRAYADLTTRTLARARDRARRADVRAIDSLIQTVLAADARLGRARPNDVAALLVAVDAEKTAAQRFRLARDGWLLRLGPMRDYRRQLSAPLERLTRLKRWLEDVRQLAGPAPKAVLQLEERAAAIGRELALMKPPAELESVHALLRSASGLAARAASSRRHAVGAGGMPAAWEASSAAAGALMMLERAVEDLKRQMEPPQLR